MNDNLRRVFLLLSILVTGFQLENFLYGEELGALTLVNGDMYRGSFDRDASKGDTMVWKSPLFDAGLVIPWSSIEQIKLPKSEAMVRKNTSPDAELINHVFELRNGEVVSGQLESFDDRDKTISVIASVGEKIRIAQTDLRSILRQTQVFLGSDLRTDTTGVLLHSAWRQVTPAIKQGGKSRWYADGEYYRTETAGTSITQMVSLPEMASIDIDVDWQQRSPNWMLTLGEPRKLEIHFRKLETRNAIAVSLLVDDELYADVSTAILPSDGVTSVSLRLLFDSNRGRFYLLKGGLPIAELRLKKSVRLKGRNAMTFTNIGTGQISLQRIRIHPTVFSSPYVPKGISNDANLTNSNGTKVKLDLKPEEVTATTETLLASGETMLGDPTSYDAETKTIGFMQADSNLFRATLDQISRIEFKEVANWESPHKAVSACLDLWDGSRFAGQSIAFDSGTIQLTLAHLRKSVRIPAEWVATIQFRAATADLSQTMQDRRADTNGLMRLSSPEGSSTGLIEKVEAKGNRLFWRPRHVLQSVPFREGISGTIDMIRDAASPVVDVNTLSTRNNTRRVQIINGRAVQPEQDLGRSLRPDEPSLFLENGDCFPASVVALSENEATITSSIFDSGKIPSDLIRGMKVLFFIGIDGIDEQTKKRMLTLPRTLRNNPPTHAVVARTGDVIRGQLRRMTPDAVTIEVRGSERIISLKTVAEIVKLTPAPELESSGKDPSALESIKPAQGLLLQALSDTGSRISIVPTRVEENLLHGDHPQLGSCKIDMSQVRRFVFGDRIHTDTSRSYFSKWQLRNAPDPKFVNEEDEPDGDGNDGTSPAHTNLIGAMAPPIELKKLDGGEFKLKDLKGKLVVLDFWATWCGPCVASLPKLNDIAQEYKGSGVEVIAVNIEQEPTEIQGLLKRLEISPNVVLDSDGAIARIYQAMAIPQTVIINAEGKIQHIFVGGGVEKKIRDSLDKLIGATGS
jgi:thiol-disulfide isomerase/thioredoxin